MSDDLVERLRQEQYKEMENPRGCRVQMAEAGQPYPCAYNCPCALRYELLVRADHIAELEAKLAKAVEALQNIAGKVPYADDPWDIARATLAELEDKTDE